MERVTGLLSAELDKIKRLPSPITSVNTSTPTPSNYPVSYPGAAHYQSQSDPGSREFCTLESIHGYPGVNWSNSETEASIVDHTQLHHSPQYPYPINGVVYGENHPSGFYNSIHQHNASFANPEYTGYYPMYPQHYNPYYSPSSDYPRSEYSRHLDSGYVGSNYQPANRYLYADSGTPLIRHGSNEEWINTDKRGTNEAQGVPM